jgi:hypothetical protein
VTQFVQKNTQFLVALSDLHRTLDRFANDILNNRSSALSTDFVVPQTSILELVALLSVTGRATRKDAKIESLRNRK